MNNQPSAKNPSNLPSMVAVARATTATAVTQDKSGDPPGVEPNNEPSENQNNQDNKQKQHSKPTSQPTSQATSQLTPNNDNTTLDDKQNKTTSPSEGESKPSTNNKTEVISNKISQGGSTQQLQGTISQQNYQQKPSTPLEKATKISKFQPVVHCVVCSVALNATGIQIENTNNRFFCPECFSKDEKKSRKTTCFESKMSRTSLESKLSET